MFARRRCGRRDFMRMTSTPPRPCKHPGCGALVHDSTGYCTKHYRTHNKDTVYDSNRRKREVGLAIAAKIRSSGHWQHFREWFRVRHPLCCDPFKTHGDLTVPMVQVHHVEGVASRPDLAFAEDNCRPLCSACHARVERIERHGDATQSLFESPPLPSHHADGQRLAGGGGSNL